MIKVFLVVSNPVFHQVAPGPFYNSKPQIIKPYPKKSRSDMATKSKVKVIK